MINPTFIGFKETSSCWSVQFLYFMKLDGACANFTPEVANSSYLSKNNEMKPSSHYTTG